jgi:hypothetical protein
MRCVIRQANSVCDALIAYRVGPMLGDEIVDSLGNGHIPSMRSAKNGASRRARIDRRQRSN